MPEPGPLTARQVVRLVATREITERMRAKSFFVGTGLLVAAILAAGVVSRLVGDDGPAATAIGIAEQESAEVVAVFAGVGELAGVELEITFLPAAGDDVAVAEAALAGGDVDVVILPADGTALFDDGIDTQALDLARQGWAQVEALRGLRATGLDDEQIAEATSVVPLEAASVEGDDDPEVSGVGVLTGTLAAILLFVSLQTFGSYVLTGVVEEKASAVVEVLLVRARPDQLLAGKVIGIGLVALLQFGLAVLAGVASLAISGVEVPAEVWSAVPVTLVWFLGGFALYATLFAVAGSLVSRQEDAQSAAAPINYSLVSVYLLVFVVGYAPESTLSTVLSMLPPIAPLLMPMRMAAGAASTLEVVVALILLVASTWWAWKLASRIYEQVLLHRGSRVSWRDARRLLRS